MQNEQHILRPDYKRTIIKRFPHGKAAQFKFPPVQVDEGIRQKYQARQVRLINPRKFGKVLTQKPMDNFIGTLKMF